MGKKFTEFLKNWKEKIERAGIKIMNNEWKKVKLGDVVKLNYGKALTSTNRVLVQFLFIVQPELLVITIPHW